MKILTGDENGLLKVLTPGEESYESYGVQSRSLGVVGMNQCSHYDIANESQAFCVLRSDGSAEIWRYAFGEGRLLLDSSINTGLESPTGILQCPSAGLVAHSKLGEGVLLTTTSEKGVNKLTLGTRFSIDGPVTASACCLGGGLAYGGLENDLQLYDVNAKKLVWKAKNVANDSLSLRVPVWVSDIAFRSPMETVSGATMLVGTGYKHVRGYDTRQESARPTFSFEIGGDFRVTAIEPSSDGHSVYVGEASGGLYLFDIRTQRRVQTLKGPIGSIREVSSSINSDFVACVGLDRFARVYSTKTNKAMSHIYIKNRTNFVQFIEDRNELQSRGAAAAAKRKSRGSTDEHGDTLAEIGSDLSEEDDEDEDDEDEDEDEDEDDKDEQEDERVKVAPPKKQKRTKK